MPEAYLKKALLDRKAVFHHTFYTFQPRKHKAFDESSSLSHAPFVIYITHGYFLIIEGRNTDYALRL